MKKNFTKTFTTLCLMVCTMFMYGQTICLVGDGASIGDLPTAEQNAYNWASSHYGSDAAYITFSDVAANGVPSNCKTIWFHFEDDPTLPASSANAAAAIGSYVTAGGGLVVSSFATEYVVTIGATAAGPTETIDKDPTGPDVAWGVRPFVGQEGHPVFAGLTNTTDWADANWGGFRTVAADTEGREAIRWWNDGSFPGTPLAGMPWWDPTNTAIPVLGHMTAGAGNVMYASAPGFNWVNSTTNSSQANLSRLTANMLNLVKQVDPEVVVAWAAASVGELPQGEQNAYNWALSHYGKYASYMSFDDIAANGLPASATTLWVHLEDGPDLPASTAGIGPAALGLLGNGGKILLSGFATQAAPVLSSAIPAVSEVIDKDPAGPDVAWGVRPLTGQENHPFFKGLSETTDWADANWGGFRTVSADVEGREAMAWWTGGAYPGTPIAGMPWWDPNNLDIPIIGTIDAGGGTIITATAPGFNWINVDQSAADVQANLYQVTANMLGETSGTPSLVLIGEGASIADLPASEQNAYSWAASNLGGAYMSFADVQKDGIPASASTVWFHVEDGADIPAGAADVAGLVGNFVRAGGRLFVSSFATDYLTMAGLIDAPTTETIDKDPAGPDVAWGVSPLAGQEGHPIFAGIESTTDWADPNWKGFRTVGADVAGHEAIRWWNDGSWPGQALAVMPWWDNTNPAIPVVGQVDVDAGEVIFASGPGYQWLPATNNDAVSQGNLEKLTTNIICHTKPVAPMGKWILLGNSDDMSGLDEDEQAAYNWAMESLNGEVVYSSFAALSADASVLADANAVWYHNDEDVQLPASIDANVVSALSDFRANGGGVFLSGMAGQLVVPLGVEDEGKGPNDVGTAAEPFLNGDRWGFKAKEPDHPIFEGLLDAENNFYTLNSETGLREDTKGWWAIGGNPVPSIFTGTYLAATEWDAGFSVLITTGEYKGNEGEGNVIVVGAGAYDWWLEGGENAEIGTVQAYSHNILTYLTTPSDEDQLPFITVSADVTSIPEGEEDGKMFTITVKNTGFVDPLDINEWTFENMPPGVSIASLERVDDNNAKVTFAGNATDFDLDILDFTVRFNGNQLFNDGGQAVYESVGAIVFDGVVELETSDLKLALLGDKPTMAELDPDESDAYTWAMTAFPNAEYVYVNADAFESADALNQYDIAWWHYDAAVDMPLEFDNPLTDLVMQEFRNSGGGVFLSSAATQYTVNIGATSKGPNLIAKSSSPAPNGDRWGFATPVPDHPIFKNLTNPFFTLLSDGPREDLLSLWDINGAPENFDGIQLTSAEWDGNFDIWVSTALFEGQEEQGDVIASSTGAYDWYLDGLPNVERGNLEVFTFNILTFLGGNTTVSTFDPAKQVAVAAFPNPANSQVTISFQLEEKANVSIEIFDVQGKMVNQLLDHTQLTQGVHQYTWNVDNTIQSGFYLYKVKADGKVGFGKLVLDK